jgi:secondary thiamine-phosphate synthase enzyme
MRQAGGRIAAATRGQGFYDITAEVQSWIRSTGIETGLLTAFIRHTSASLVIQENADPDVVHDLARFFGDLAPERGRSYRHTAEGPDDMPAHIRSALTSTSLSIPVQGGRAALGTWQGIYLFEHRRAPHRREIALHLIGE